MIRTAGDFLRFLMPHCSTQHEFTRRYYQLLNLTRNRICRKNYHKIAIPKKSGGLRLLHEPYPFLKRIQRSILLLLAQGEVSEHAMAYLKNKSICDNACCHLAKPLVVRLDINDFFGAIEFRQVFHAIDNALRHSPLVGRHEKTYTESEAIGQNYNNSLSYFFTQLCTLNGILPQGAPTSPLLSNLVFLPIDRGIASYCQKRSIVYTRYCDDLTFSGNFNHHALISFVDRLLTAHGFTLNTMKTAILGSGFRQKVTGVLVNEKMQAPREYRREIRQALYYLKKFGVEEHLGRQQEFAGRNVTSADAIHYLNSLLGKMRYVLQLNPLDQTFQGYYADCLQIKVAYCRLIAMANTLIF